MPPTTIISGGSRGLGLAVVERLLGRGDRVATFSRSGSAALESLVAIHPARLHAEQIDAASTVIESRPRLGLFVVHSSAVNVYSRLWVLYELWFAQQLKVKCQGLVDATRWPAELFSLEAAAIDKALETLAGVSRWQDRVYLLRNRLADVELSAVAQSARTFFEQILEDLRASQAAMDLGRTGIEMMAG